MSSDDAMPGTGWSRPPDPRRDRSPSTDARPENSSLDPWARVGPARAASDEPQPAQRRGESAGPRTVLLATAAAGIAVVAGAVGAVTGVVVADRLGEATP